MLILAFISKMFCGGVEGTPAGSASLCWFDGKQRNLCEVSISVL